MKRKQRFHYQPQNALGFTYFCPKFSHDKSLNMKKTLLSLACLLLWLASARAQVIITEIMYNPPESGTDSLEYIELHNFQPFPADISGWNFTQGVEHVFAAGTVMPPGGYLVLSKSASAMQNVFGIASTQWDNGALTNSPGEDIELRDADGNVKDYVDYLNAAPWPASAAGMGPSIVLCDFTSDNSLPANWQAASTATGIILNNIEIFANPGAASNCPVGNQITANDDNFSVPNGQPTVLNIEQNDLIINAVVSLTITAQPAHGTATVVGSTIVYQSNVGYCGSDQLEYQICDAMNCDVAAVNIIVKCYPQRSIASVSTENASGVADSLEVNCELAGTVYGGNIRPLNNNLPSLLFTIIDGNGDGIAVSSLAGNFGYTVKEKDRVSVRGTIRQFNGMTEIRPDTIFKLSENNPLLAPIVVTSLSEATESKFIKINNLSLVDPAEWTTGSGSSGFNVRAVSSSSPNDTILIRIDRDVETYDAPVPPQPFNLTGIGGQFDTSNPFTSGYQVLPRYNPDISTLMVGTHEADFSADVTLSPNPATRMLLIETRTPFERVTLIGANGRNIKTLENPAPQHRVDVSLLPAGVYFVRFEKGGQFWTAKFVKQ
jgi:hypothetical protein